MERSYAASASYLAQVGEARPPLTVNGEPPMLPPTPIRRLLLVPLVVVIACALAALTPAVALLTAAFNLISSYGPAPSARAGRGSCGSRGSGSPGRRGRSPR